MVETDNKTYQTQKTDSKSYEKGYGIFLTRTNFREKILTSFNESLPQVIYAKKIVQILDVGCGNGKMSSKYLESITASSPGIEIDLYLIEPAEESLKSACLEVNDFTRSVTVFNTSIEEFVKLHGGMKFDIIIASYVFYHTDPDIITKLAACLSSMGSLAIMMGTGKHPLRSHPVLKEISKHGDTNLLEAPLINLKSSGNYQISRNEVITDVDLKGFWKDDVLSPEGEDFFSFIFNNEIVTFSNQQLTALNETLSRIFNNEDGIIHPIHELIWIERGV